MNVQQGYAGASREMLQGLEDGYLRLARTIC